MNSKTSIAAVAIATAATLGACSSPRPLDAPVYSSTSSGNYVDYGVIDSIQVVQADTGSNSGAGALLGGAVGGLVGNQIGQGNGRTAATIAGAVGGAVAGNELERSRRTGALYQLNVRLRNGSYYSVTQDNIDNMRVGDRVRIENNRAYRD